MSLSASVRENSFTLQSNDRSTPVIVSPNRGYREGYSRADISWHLGHNDWKAGIDVLFAPVHESLSYQITNPSHFDPGTLAQFSFNERKWDVEPAFYVQDTFHAGNWNVSAGLRFDHYGFVTHESAWSPRLAVSRYMPPTKTLLHFSYDRVFQTPAMENLLLASSPEGASLNPVIVRLPVRPSRANYFEGGLTQALFGKLRLAANVFRRNFRNFADDDVLLDTVVSFPIAFDNARIIGEEIRLAVAEWGRFSGFLSYSNQSASAQGPITGGLFLGSEAGDELTDTTRFAVTRTSATPPAPNFARKSANASGPLSAQITAAACPSNTTPPILTWIFCWLSTAREFSPVSILIAVASSPLSHWEPLAARNSITRKLALSIFRWKPPILPTALTSSISPASSPAPPSPLPAAPPPASASLSKDSRVQLVGSASLF